MRHTQTAQDAAEALGALVRQRGRGLCLDHRAVERLLGERLGGRTASMVALHYACREGVAAELAAAPGEALPEMAWEKLIARLHARTGLSIERAAEGVAGWAQALDRPCPEGRPKPPRRALPAGAKRYLRPGGALVELVGHRRPLRDLVFDPSGERVATCGEDRSVRTWEARSGRALSVMLGGHRDWVRGLIRAGEDLLSAGDDGALRRWRARDGARGPRIRVHEGVIHALAGGERWWSGGEDGRLVSGEGDALRRVLELGRPVRALAVDPGGRWVAAGLEGELRLVDPRTGGLLRREKLAGEPCLSAGPGGLLAVGDAAGLRLMEAETGEVLMRRRGATVALALHPHGRTLAAAGADEVVRVLALPEGEVSYRFEQGRAVRAMDFTEGGLLGLAFADGRAQVCPMRAS